MNVWILCNEDAGRGLSGDQLRDLIEREGHTVSGVAKQYDEGSPSPVGNADIVVAAGGDGTVAKVAAIASRTSATLAILPLGTANNIATSLGLTAPVPELIASWSTAKRVPFDLGHARSGSKEWLVVEGIGGGLVPAGIAKAEAVLEHREIATPAAEVTAAVRAFRDALVELEPRPWTLVLDGRQISDSFLLLEVLNIRSIGPNLVLGADATPTDGYFDVVMAQESQRQELLTYLDHRLDGRDTQLSLPQHRAREVVIDGCAELHIDDERVDVCALGAISIRIHPGAITVLI